MRHARLNLNRSLTCLRHLIVLIVLVYMSMAGAEDSVESESESRGPFAVETGSYKLPAGIDAEVTTRLPVELWAIVYRP